MFSNSFADYFPDTRFDYLKYTPHLRSLHLHLNQSKWDEPATWIEFVFKPLLSSEPMQNSYPLLQHLTIDLKIEREDQLDWDRWAAVDKLFENPVFSVLKTVDFRIITLDDNNLASSCVEVLRETLAFLTGSGKLQIRTSSFLSYYDS